MPLDFAGRAAQAGPREARPRALSSLTAEGHDHALRLCKEWDVNQDGTISRKELGKALKQIFADCSEDDVESVMQAVDVNKDGVLQYNEVLSWLRLPPYEKRCFEDNLRSYIRGAMRVPSPARPLAGELAAQAGCDAKLWDERLLQSFTHPLLGRFRPLPEPVDSGLAPPETVRVRLIKRGVRASAGEAACTVVVRRGPAGEPAVDASVRAPEYAGDGVQHLLTTLRHYAEVHIRILEAFCSTIEATDKPGKQMRLRFEPPPVLGRDLREVPPVPQALWSATALALARLSPARQRKLAKAHIDLCVGSSGAAAEYQSVLDAKVRAAASAVGSASLSEEALPQRKGGFSWVRHDNDPEARLCRLQAFALTQRAVYAGGYEVGAGPGRPGKSVALTQVDRMIHATSVRIAEPQQTNAPPPTPPPGRPTELRVPSDLGLPERSTAMEVAQALTAKGKKVAAVNAASAYSPGGGCSSGGRHALEEAWCTCSTLYRSMTAAKAAELAGGPSEGATGALPPQHVPTLGCVVSPEVELFREGTERGYGFLPAPVRLCGVLSVAMFNRNPSVTDSPLDCPEDPATYVAQTQAKLEAVVLAAGDLGADVLVVPDVGCGVFQNDALVVGGCLGAVVRRRSGRVREVVVLAGTHAGFAEACKRTYRGEDPRETCPAGDNCSQLSDPLHAARMLHRGSRDEVEAALVALAAHPEEVKKPECRYGALCRSKDTRHLARFLHPPPSDTVPWSKVLDDADLNPAPMEYAPQNPTPLEFAPPEEPMPAFHPKVDKAPPVAAAGAGDLRLPPAGSPTGGASSSRPVCKYGEACYSKNPRHFKDFSHPWMEGGESSAKAKNSSNTGLEGGEKSAKAKDSSNPGLEGGEKSSKAKEQEDAAQVHDLLTLAKAGSWTEVKVVLRRRPELINGRPECRSFGLVHHAAWQIRMDEMEALVLDFGADLGSKTKEGKSAEEVLEESVQLGGLSPAETARAAALQKWLRRRSAWRSEASPTSAAPAVSPASGGPAVGPAVAGALAETFAGAAASPASGPREPELKRGGMVLTVRSCLNMKLEGDYVELAKAHNGFAAYWKAPAAGGALGGAAAHFVYYNFRTSLGWVIDTDLSDSNEPLAYLGASQCGADPSAKAYGEAWKVHCINKIAGGYYSRDSVMRIKRR